jgi:NADH-quinone oxidoreductase subunit N
MPTSLPSLLLPELILIVAAGVLFMVGLSMKASSRRFAPILAMLALAAALVVQVTRVGATGGATQFDDYGGEGAGGIKFGTVRVAEFAQYVKLIVIGVGMLLTLLAWPTNDDATGSPAHHFGNDAGEFFALMLLSLAGVLLVAAANDIMLLFLGFELASIPTYILVSLSRPTPVAQEAGVKYFFLGAFAAAILLFGFSYLYGSTGSTNLHEIMLRLHPRNAAGVIDWGARVVLNPWQTLAVILLVAGFAFKMAAVPLHFYAGDVYQGAATPVTAFLSFVPKTVGFVALIKVLYALGGPNWLLPEPLVRPNGTGLLFWLAALTMTVGNVLGLLQYNVKRVLAYSSVAHTGYMLVALAALGATSYVATPGDLRAQGLQAVLFYLAAYGIMNVGAFGVLQLIPARDGRNAAETFEDLAGQGRRHVALGLAMAASCFSLTGIPLTVGFMGKLMVIKPALVAAAAPTLAPGGPSVRTAMTALIVLTMVNAAVSAAYYLKIVAAMFLRTADSAHPPAAHPAPIFTRPTAPVFAAVMLSVGGIVLFGAIPPATELLGTSVKRAAAIENNIPGLHPTAATTAAASESASPAAAAAR